MKTCRVLIVDDEPDCADSLAMLIALRGHQVEVAYRGDAAIAQIASFRPTHVILDLAMPGMDGYAVARRLRSGGFNGVLVALTGYGRASDIERCSTAGFDRHYLKPMMTDDITAFIESACAEPASIS